jgi:hypothetical protein
MLNIERNEKRVNGWAVGDRAAVVEGEYKGAVGKVTHVWAGCRPDRCATHCYLASVHLTHVPPGMTAPRFNRSFRLADITHID